jgi:hypothetical protein
MTLEDPIAARILESIRGSRLDCSALVRLVGGVANFTYRGKLITALEDGTSTVVIKHAESYIAGSPTSGFEFDPIRMVC